MMSCQKQANRAGTGAPAAGVPGLSSKTGHLIGNMLTATNRALDNVDRGVNIVGRTVAPVTTMAMNVVGARNPQARRATGFVAGAAMGTAVMAATGQGQKALQGLAGGGKVTGGVAGAVSSLLPHAGTVRLTIRAVDTLSGAVGSSVGALSKTGEAGQVVQEKRKMLFFKSKIPVKLWKSGLTGLINGRDIAVRRRHIVSSRGTMFEIGGKTWHRGTTVLKMPEGQKRTITHLQSLNAPATHYYFNRSVSNENAVGLAGGQIKPDKVPGLVGQISRTESLCPSWVAAKQALFKAHLHWPGGA
jgi:hypothetical protein